MPTVDHDWAEPFRSQLLAFASQLLGRRFPGKLEIADLVQKTLLEAYRQPPPVLHATAKLAWLKAALRNNFNDEVRRLMTMKRSVNREVPIDSKVPARDDSPSRRMKISEAMHEILKHIGTLPADQQQALRLRFIEDLSVEEVARQMKKSRAAVNGLTRRGFLALRSRFESQSKRYT